MQWTVARALDRLNMRPVSASVLSGTLQIAMASTLLFGCASGKKWVNRPFVAPTGDKGVRIYDGRTRSAPGSYDKQTSRFGEAKPNETSELSQPEEDFEGPNPQVKLVGRPASKKHLVHVPPPDGRLLGTFRNTYYDFPAEASFGQQLSDPSEPRAPDEVPLMDAMCSPIKSVARGFYESLCVQGSGTLIDGRTVSFAKRNCDCAAVCPRTSQKICFDALDPREFPWGRGALGKAITPLLSVAVDSDVIPLGTQIYIAEYDGVERHAGGGKHNGCFVAEDRGMKVVGKHVDIFTGNPSVTEHLNALVPSNHGVHVYLGTARCREQSPSQSP